MRAVTAAILRGGRNVANPSASSRVRNCYVKVASYDLTRSSGEKNTLGLYSTKLKKCIGKKKNNRRSPFGLTEGGQMAGLVGFLGKN